MAQPLAYSRQSGREDKMCPESKAVSSQNPLFCFTSDLDWAPESMIEETIKIFSTRNTPLVPFITHPSESIKKHYEGEKAKHVGLHPNFLPDSTQGKDLDAVMSYVTSLWPEAKCFRSHYYTDSFFISQAFHNKGFKYDSNLCLHLQPNIVPLQHASGLLRFPVFLDDISYADKNGDYNLQHILPSLNTPGLKIFNFHPIHICLNTPSREYYQKVRKQVYENKEDWKNLIYKGDGIRTFLEQLLLFIQGKQAWYLDDLYHRFSASSEYIGVWAGKNLLTNYKHADDKNRAKILQTVMNAVDSKQKYITSPDFNLRELEIDFIIEGITQHATKNNPKILDIGCGNGYTDLSIAKKLQADITGLDFSSKMIEGATYLRDNMAELKSLPTFNVGDATKLPYEPETFDAVVSERMLLNLPNRETQFSVIDKVHRILKKNGIYIMVEGTRNGLRRLNKVRTDVGLEEIPDISENNVSSLKFEETELEAFLEKRFVILEKKYWGMYYLISRVVHPLLVYPDKPKFDSKINEVARKIAERYPDYNQSGHLVGYILRKGET